MANDLKGIVETGVRTMAGLIGTAAGTAVGVAAGVASALTAKSNSAGSSVDPTAHELYWREHFAAEPYYDASYSFEDYLPAWRTGWEGRAKYLGRRFQDVERELQADFYWNRGKRSLLLWSQAREAVRAAFERAV
jgi:hypothetical protein